MPWPVAVIDIGATSLRMQISEIHPDGRIRKLESFSQAVSIGKDSFINGRIDKDTIEDCVHVLRIYRAKLNEYGINDESQLRIVATSAVKEAANRLAFVDRVFVATGFEIRPLEEAELHRLTFVGAMPLLADSPEVFSEPSMICEISGGTTEVLFFDREEILFSQSYRQGSLRIRKVVESFGGPMAASRSVIESQLLRMIGQIKLEADKYNLKNLVAIGGDIRFAANQLLGNKKQLDDSTQQIGLEQLGLLTTEILSESADRLVSRFHLSLPEAESLGPALLSYYLIGKELGFEKLYVSDFNLRDGIVEEMARGGEWSQMVERQTVSSAIKMGEKFRFDKKHAVHVARLACQVFDQLESVHGLGRRFRVILEMAAILHEVGQFVSTRSYHKHTMYLIRNAEFFGISAMDVELVALVARYHRRATPQPNHDGYSKLARKERVSVAKLASILRIAKALDASRRQPIKKIECKQLANQVEIKISDVTDISVETLEMGKAAQMFSEIFGAKVLLRINKDQS